MGLKSRVLNVAHFLLRVYWKLFRPHTWGVQVLIEHIEKPGFYLLVSHTYGDGTLLSLPGGGFNPKKETVLNAAKREVFEELGVKIPDPKYIGEYKTDSQGKRDTVSLLYTRIRCEQSILPNSEIEHVHWISRDEFIAHPDVSRVAKYALECHEKRG